MSSTFRLGDAGDFDTLAGPESLDCIVTDPPGGINFMGCVFDDDKGGRDHWIAWLADKMRAAYQALKPGGYALVWAMPRTMGWTHRALEDAGFLIGDNVVHLFGTGWPKNALTQLKPASEQWILAQKPLGRMLTGRANVQGKKLTVKGNIALHGTGALQIDASRVARGERDARVNHAGPNGFGFDGMGGGNAAGTTTLGSWPTNALLSHDDRCEERGTRDVSSGGSGSPVFVRDGAHVNCYGTDNRVPGTQQIKYASANGLETVPAFSCLASCPCGLSTLAPSGGAAPLCDCGEAMLWECAVAELDRQSGTLHSGFSAGFVGESATSQSLGTKRAQINPATVYADKGGASRFFPTFFYAAKAATSERHAGAEHLRWARDASTSLGWREVDQVAWDALPAGEQGKGNIHPTVKSLKLARWLVRLLCPPGGRGGDPFCGSGSIGIAAALEGFDWISSDLSHEAVRIAQARMVHWEATTTSAVPAQQSLALETAC